jgi:hypothetical protein
MFLERVKTWTGRRNLVHNEPAVVPKHIRNSESDVSQLTTNQIHNNPEIRIDPLNLVTMINSLYHYYVGNYTSSEVKVKLSLGFF